MTSPEILFLSMVLPTLPPFSVAVKIECVFSVEKVETLRDDLPSVKTLTVVDIVVFDEKVISNFKANPLYLVTYYVFS